ncbi:hypothetical protein H4582DRAFT_395049 [Lactarius indigo]|nr:hypothetical protein H4582DRAFT_395049 [Lactarius indigo]
MSTSIALNALVLGEDLKDIFSVQVPGTETISDLRKAIENKKKKKKNTSCHIDASTFDLWKVSIPVDENLEAKINGLKFENKTPLLAVEGLSGVFSGKIEDEHLHIVVQPPYSARIAATSSQSRSPAENVSTLKKTVKDKNEECFPPRSS